MGKKYNFTEELKTRLEEYNDLKSQISQLEERQESIRTQIEQWMKMHEENHFEIEDHLNHIWKLTITSRHSHRVKDYDLLKSILPDQHKHLITESDSETFTIRQIDKFSKEWQLKAIS